jgi:hypothetical protein
MNNYGFIITRHVNSNTTNKYWNHSVQCIQRFYPHKKTVIIDDNSNKDFLKADREYPNVEIVQSEFSARGELLPYYYYNKHKWFDNAVIIHDSVFFHRRVPFESLVASAIKVLPLWFFNPDKENVSNTMRISSSLRNNGEITQSISWNDRVLGLNKTHWFGCFGIQSFINHSFLSHLERKYQLSNMLKAVNCRPDRCSSERIFGAMFFTEYRKINKVKSVFGNIHTYQRWGYTFNEYDADLKRRKVPRAIIKVWTGR